MKIYQSPDNDNSERRVFGKKLFLAGGISNCPNWQADLVERYTALADKLEDVTIYNPRRVGDLAKNGKDAFDQIYWEHCHLKLTSYYLFWFPEETVCPITLFELGKYATQMQNFDAPEKNLFIGVHPNYSRKFDVEVQMSIMFPQMVIYNSLDALFERSVDVLSHNMEARVYKSKVVNYTKNNCGWGTDVDKQSGAFTQEELNRDGRSFS